ncbi:MAG: acetolactate decarboxylase [Phycisphaerae bacterium]|jgi:acetolactate decarboxylase|nr:acetolactate decarboxylase [Phycisphaerae bacterium]
MASIIRRITLIALLGVVFASGCAPPSGVVYQYSTINALLEGVYDGDMTCARLLQHGDFGLGTFNALDGEMIVIDRTIYKIRSDGKAYSMGGNETTPFAVVTAFEPNMIFNIEHDGSPTLEQLLEFKVPESNLIQAIRIDGHFKYVKVRSVPKQKRPYRRLAKVTEDQSVFELKDVRGTLVGFLIPPHFANVNMPGYHFHFITEDRSRGGHVLKCRTGHVVMQIDEIPEFHLVLPETGDFLKARLAGDRSAELEKAEK